MCSTIARGTTASSPLVNFAVINHALLKIQQTIDGEMMIPTTKDDLNTDDTCIQAYFPREPAWAWVAQDTERKADYGSPTSHRTTSGTQNEATLHKPKSDEAQSAHKGVVNQPLFVHGIAYTATEVTSLIIKSHVCEAHAEHKAYHM